MKNIYEQESANKRKSFLIMSLFVLFVVGVVYVFSLVSNSGLSMVGVALLFSGLLSLGSYYYSDKIILSLSNARKADKDRDFDYFTVAENLAMVANIPVPDLYVIEDSAMNAFATGRDPEHAVVVATTGLLSRLNRTKLEGVVAHELSHVKNYDTRLMSIVTILVGLIALLADWFLRLSMFGGRRSNDDRGQVGAIMLVLGLLLALLSPLIANLIKLAISRRREFLADAGAAKMTRYPEGLASALEKIAVDREPLEVANKATAHLYISNPLKNRKGAVGWLSKMFNTHPPVEERIQALRS